MPEVTYRQLDDVLRSLGFTIYEPEPGTRVYEHAETGALLAFPIFPENTNVYPHHLVGTRMTLDAFGIATEPKFASRLQQAS